MYIILVHQRGEHIDEPTSPFPSRIPCICKADELDNDIFVFAVNGHRLMRNTKDDSAF
jgi:hypothetical protein